MRQFLIRRFIASILSFMAATMIVFGISRGLGDPTLLLLPQQGYGMDPKELAKAKHDLHLDRNLVVQYGYWLNDLLHGRLGNDLIDRMPIGPKLVTKLGPTGMLAGCAWIFATVFGIPLGVLSATRRGSVWDYLGRGLAVFGQSLPTFWTGIVGIVVFAVFLHWLPAGTMGTGIPFKHIVLPTIVLGWLPMAGYVRLVRSRMLIEMDSEYVKLARAKGVGGRSVVWRHAFRNSLIAPLTFGALLLAGLISGSIAVETVFGWPGIAQWAVNAVFNNDLPVLVDVTLVFTVLYLFFNFLVDIGYLFADPRIRY